MSNLTTGKIQSMFSSESVQKRLNEILGKNAPTFATSVMQCVKSNELLSQAEPSSVIGAAMTAATINLPINNNIGFAYIIPFREKQPDGTYMVKAQFQLSYKGFIQLAQRSGQFQTLNVSDVREGEITGRNRLTGEMSFEWIEDDAIREKQKVVGYVGYFSLINGFSKTMFMSMDELNSHGKKFSQTFKKNFGLWKDDFDSMAKKTVIKLLLSKYAPLSIELGHAVNTDQAVITSDEDGNVDETKSISYPDNEKPEIDPEEERIMLLINGAKNQEELDFAKGFTSEKHLEAIKQKQKELNESKK